MENTPTDRRFNHMGPSIRTVETPSIRVKHSIYRPTCQAHHQGLVFRRVIFGARRVPGAEPFRSDSKSPVVPVTN